MTRLLIRSGKDPFTAVAAETTLTQDVFNSNSGNYLFQHAVWRALAIDGTELVSNGTLSERRPPEPGDAERINQEFDHFVIPLANAFRPDFSERLDRLSDLITDVTIPTTVVGIGAQAAVGHGVDSLESISASVKRFVGLILDRSASIGVRGQFTHDYLVDLGFPESSIDIIGCPSLFLHGRDLAVEKKVPTIGPTSRLALNLTPEVPGIGAFATTQADRHPHLTYIGQDAHDLRLLLWGTRFPHVDDDAVPVHLHHPLYQSDRMRLFLDMWTWCGFLATQDFAYGTRFHGNVAALLGRTPALLLAHDSRTIELADYHQMPFRLMPSFDVDLSARQLYDETDLSAFNAAMPDRFDRYTAFLDRNGLEHIWRAGATTSLFDERLGGARFPAPVRPVTASDGSQIASRLQWLREGMVLDITRHPQAYEPPYPHPPWQGAGSRHARIQAQDKQRFIDQRREIDDLRAEVRAMQRRTLVGLVQGALRVLRRKLGRPQP